MLWCELKRAQTKWLAPVAIVLLTYTVSTSIRPGVLMWGDVTFGLTVAFIFLNPLVAGVVAWETGRRESSGIRTRLATATRYQLLARFIHLGALIAWPLGAFVLMATVFAIWMEAAEGYGEPVILWLTSTVFGMIFAAAIGYLLGVLFTARWYVPVTAVLVVYAGWATLSGSKLPYWVIQAFPTTLNETNAFVRYIEPTFIGQILWYLAAAILITLIATFTTRRLGWSGVLTATTAIAVGTSGLGLLATTNGQATTGYNSREYECEKTPITICVKIPFQRGLPELETTFTAFNNRVAETSLVVTQLEQNVAGIGEKTTPGAQSLYVRDLREGFAPSALTQFVETYAGIHLCKNNESFFAHTVVDAWLTGQQVRPSQQFIDRAKTFTDLPESERQNWLQKNETKVLNCDLTLEDLP